MAASRDALTAEATMRRWQLEPQTFVRDQFNEEPDAWQEDVLAAFPTTPRIAMAAAKGAGKTTTEAWLAWNFLATRPHPKIGATSVTKENLRDGLWAEMAKWHQRSEFLKAYFEWTNQRIFCKTAPETWFMSARSWPKDADPQVQAQTLAGFHADYVLYILDESGSIPDSVMVAADASMASGKECHIVQGGNTTNRNGPLYRAWRNQNMWRLFFVTGDPDDPKRSPRIDIQWARDMIAEYGPEDPWVLVNVFAQFPEASINALISQDEVEEAMSRQYRQEQYQHAPKILGVDVARYGMDKSCVFRRQGLVAFEPKVYRSLDSMQGAAVVAREWDDWNADACFIDETGGFGAGWIDALRQLGRDPIGVQFAGKATSPRYYNKRAEIYFELVKWIREGGALPPSPALKMTLPAMQYTHKKDQVIIEPKDQLKARIGVSPDEADSLAETFTAPVTARGLGLNFPPKPRHEYEYDPYAELYRSLPETYGGRYR